MADFPTVLTGMLPDSALRMGVCLSKELLRKHAARVKGDKALIDAAVSSAWVTTLRHDTCGVAPYKSETEGDFSELLVVGVQAHTEITPAQIARLQQLIHIAVQYPLLPQEGSAHPRTSARKIRWTLRSALHAPKVSSLGSRHRHLVRALSLTLLAASLGKTSLVSEEQGQNPHTDYICPGVKNPWTALSGLPGKGWTKTAQGLPKINILRGFLLFAGSSLAPSRSPR